MTDHPTDVPPDGRPLPDGYEDRVEQALRTLHSAVRTAVVPPQSAAVRRRAERRAVHRGVAGLAVAAAVVAAVTGTVALLPADHATKPPPAPVSRRSAEPTASPVSVRAAALKPADLGAGYSVEGEAPGSPFPADTIPGQSCDAWRRPEPGASSHVRGGYNLSFKAPRGHFDMQEIWQFDAQWASIAMRETRNRLQLCAQVQGYSDPGVLTVSQWTPVATGFAGADSVAVRHTLARNGVMENVDFFVVVRQGDLVSSLWLSDQRWTAPRLRQVGRAMATRLCAANHTC